MNENLEKEVFVNVSKVRETMDEYVSGIRAELEKQSSLKGKKKILENKRSEIGSFSPEGDTSFVERVLKLEAIRNFNERIDSNIESSHQSMDPGFGSYSRRASQGVEKGRRGRI